MDCFQIFVRRDKKTHKIKEIQVPPLKPCTECGLCCVIGYIPYSFSERKELPIGLKVFTTSRGNMRELEGRQVPVCAAFCGELYRPCSCAVQENKPKVCREYPPGTLSCVKYIYNQEKLKLRNGDELVMMDNKEARRKLKIIVNKDGTWKPK